VSGIAQVVIGDEAARAAVAELPAETVVEIVDSVVVTPQAPDGVELQQPAINVLSESAGELLFEMRRPALDAPLPRSSRALADLAVSSRTGTDHLPPANG
jgi:nondiscriminating aspartyl-tRNA synthetase